MIEPLQENGEKNTIWLVAKEKRQWEKEFHSLVEDPLLPASCRHKKNNAVTHNECQLDHSTEESNDVNIVWTLYRSFAHKVESRARNETVFPCKGRRTYLLAITSQSSSRYRSNHVSECLPSLQDSLFLGLQRVIYIKDVHWNLYINSLTAVVDQLYIKV